MENLRIEELEGIINNAADSHAKMKALVQLLDMASRAYYQESREIMDNIRYDKYYDMLVALEAETGVVMAGSPTEKVGYEVLSDLPKENHPSRMLSLDKTKEPEVLAAFLGNQPGVLSWKLDGLTIVLTYEGGRLAKAVTRGNGDVGEVITENAKAFSNIPLVIPFKKKLVLRGEAIITYSQFERINSRIEDAAMQYKNPRNLCSGTVRQLDTRITKGRGVEFFAFALVSAEGESWTYRHEQYDWLKSQGFSVVEHVITQWDRIQEDIRAFEGKISGNDFPSDGLVLLMDDIAYGDSLGQTAKFPRNAMAFKWRDELAETTLLSVEWSASRTGLINPVAVFEPVELEGTTVSRASVHNVSIVRELALGIGDRIRVYKANMIIPQIDENLTRSGNLEIPSVCPVCGSETQLKSENGVESLYCPNPKCLAKQIKSFTHFVSRDAMNIEGLSEATIEKLIARGCIKELADLFDMEKFKEEITAMEGFGEKSFENLAASVKKASETTAVRLLYSLGIPNIGLANAKNICKFCGHNWQMVQNLTTEDLLSIEGIGDIMAAAYRQYFDNPENQRIVSDILGRITFAQVAESLGSQSLAGLTFVITGSLENFGNRSELKDYIEGLGGKVTGSVTAKTSYLINNDALSGSSKNKKAKELGVEVITEEEFLQRFGSDR